MGCVGRWEREKADSFASLRNGKLEHFHCYWNAPMDCHSERSEESPHFVRRAIHYAIAENALRGRCHSENALGLRTVALFVLLAGTARTGIVAPDLLAGNALRGSGAFAGAGVAGMLQFAPLLTLKLFLQLVDGGRRCAGLDGHGARAARLLWQAAATRSVARLQGRACSAPIASARRSRWAGRRAR